MAQLRDRLKRIRQSRREVNGNSKSGERAAAESPAGKAREALPALGFSSEWESAAYKTLKRTLRRKEVLSFQNSGAGFFPPALAILVPDLFRYKSGAETNLEPSGLLFFDLETTGLSGGAGTVAFLAAFGRFAKDGLEVTQYLLLDFPGESDFIELVLKEFSSLGDSGKPPLVVSFNGKTFDSQILKTRCLMNGFSPPEYFHADLLHPCRRLWKKVLPDCSQGTIETAILGLDRTGDTPGALAPEIWFSFLKTGGAKELTGICDHNVKDIRGLARIFLCLAEIAAFPLEGRGKYNVDIEALALRWRDLTRRRGDFFGGAELKTGRALLDAAAGDNCPSALRLLAVEAEWNTGDLRAALDYTEKILSRREIPPGLEDETLRRRERLVKKITAAARC